ncbi:hypothetical protein RRG08_045995 [Elysia crispata]|uniref:Uncharacterized protein n=1 Tax=Elysia crispata TaxID=231223 RepID=A0AAE1D7H6_9GAST|nr:hypothetical protein RRG08_045995 [Elysia crispata]
MISIPIAVLIRSIENIDWLALDLPPSQDEKRPRLHAITLADHTRPFNQVSINIVLLRKRYPVSGGSG